MSNVTRIRRLIAATVTALGLVAFAPTASADAKPITHTARYRHSDHHVAERWVAYVEFVRVRDGGNHYRMVRYELNNGSKWISPNDDCLGPSPQMCEEAWHKARKAKYVHGQG